MTGLDLLTGTQTALGTMPDPRLVFAGLAGAMALAVIALAVRSLIRQDRARYGPTCRRFCRAVGVNAAQRRLLLRLARRTGAPSIVSLLISRGCFEHAVERCPASKVEARRLAAIRTVVFEGKRG